MGKPVFDPAKIPTSLVGSPPLDIPLSLGDQSIQVSAVSIGNPHAVLFTDDLSASLVVGLGPLVECSEWFPSRTNVDFVQVLATDQIRMRVWERGSGETLSCGSGACAAVVVSVLRKETKRNVRVELPGGELFVTWKNNSELVLQGPAQYVFSGEWIDSS